MKRWLSLLLCILLAGMLVACGEGNDVTEGEGDDVNIIVADKVTDSIGINSWIGRRARGLLTKRFLKSKVEHVAKTATDDFNQIKDIKNILATNSARIRRQF